MAINRVETPSLPSGSEQERIDELYRYLTRLADDLNISLEAIGGNELTDDERKIVSKIIAADKNVPEDQVQQELYAMESLKSLIIKTASFVSTQIDEFSTTFLRDSVAEGRFGKYVRKTGLNVVVNPEGVTQNFSFEEVVQGLREYEINAKNYIKTGLLRTESGLPVYGVAIGKDIVTFSQDGTETYHDGNKVAELLPDKLTFWQNGTMIAKYTGSRISFYNGNTEVFYIENGKVYSAKDLELASGKKVKLGDWTFDKDGACYKYGDNSEFRIFKGSSATSFTNLKSGIKIDTTDNAHEIQILAPVPALGTVGGLRIKFVNATNDHVAMIDFSPVGDGSLGWRQKWKDVVADNLRGTNMKATYVYENGTRVKTKQTAVSSPNADGTGVSFIDTVSQDENGKVTLHKRTVPTMSGATASANSEQGLVPVCSSANRTKFLKGTGGFARPMGRGFQVKQYQCQFTLNAGAGRSLTELDFGASIPSGYSPVGIAYFNTGNSNIEVYYLDGTASGSNAIAMVKNRNAGSAITTTMAIKILYIENGSD